MYRAIIEKRNPAKKQAGVKFGSFGPGGSYNSGSVTTLNTFRFQRNTHEHDTHTHAVNT